MKAPHLNCARPNSVGAFSNPLLLWGIAFELALAALLIYVPPFQSLLATAALTPADVLFTLPFPFIVWGADELRRHLIRRRSAQAAGARGDAPRVLDGAGSA